MGGIGVRFLGVVIFIEADATASGAALWVYLPALATASLTAITLWERRRRSRLVTRQAASMPIFTTLFGSGTYPALSCHALWFEGGRADWESLAFAVSWLGLVVSVGAYGLMFI